MKSVFCLDHLSYDSLDEIKAERGPDCGFMEITIQCQDAEQERVLVLPDTNHTKGTT